MDELQQAIQDELGATSDPRMAIGNCLALIDEVIGPDTVEEQACTTTVLSILHRVLDQAFPVSQEA